MPHKLLFVHVPKAAGTSVSRTLAAATGKQSNVIKVGQMPRLAGPLLAHLTASTILGILRWDRPLWGGLFKFAVARNPWARYVSLYFHFRRSAKRASNTPYRARMIDVAKKRSFPEWASIYVGKTYCEPLRHYTHDHDGEQIVDAILRMNSLSLDISNILGTAGLVADTVGHENKRPDWRPFQTFYNDATKERVATVCKYEIQRFEFAFDEIGGM